MSINTEYHAGIAWQNDPRFRLRRRSSCCIGEVHCFAYSPRQNSDTWESSGYICRCCSSLRSKKYVGKPDSDMSITTQLKSQISLRGVTSTEIAFLFSKLLQLKLAQPQCQVFACLAFLWCSGPWPLHLRSISMECNFYQECPSTVVETRSIVCFCFSLENNQTSLSLKWHGVTLSSLRCASGGCRSGLGRWTGLCSQVAVGLYYIIYHIMQIVAYHISDLLDIQNIKYLWISPIMYTCPYIICIMHV